MLALHAPTILQPTSSIPTTPDSSGSQTLAREVQHVASLRSHYEGWYAAISLPFDLEMVSGELDWQLLAEGGLVVAVELIAEINSLLEIRFSSGFGVVWVYAS